MDQDRLRETHYNAAIVHKRVCRDSVMVIRVVPDGPLPQPMAGQWVELGLGVWEPVMPGAEAGTAKRLAPDSVIRRAYSVSSPILDPGGGRLVRRDEETSLEFFLSLVFPPAQRASRVPNLTGRLFCREPGDRLFLAGEPLGNYTLAPVGPEDDLLFLATGTGEAPHNRMIWELLRRGHPGRIASVVSVRYRGDLAYDGVHRRLAGLFPRYRYHAIATREPDFDGRRLQDLFADGTIESAAGFAIEPGRTQVFLCGNPGMIGPPRLLTGRRVFPEAPGLVEILERDRGMNSDLRRGAVDVHYERYW